MEKMKIGNHMVSVWVISVLLVSIIVGGVVVGYVWQTLNIPFNVNEPLKVLSYPSAFNLYPGDTEEFNISLQNGASENYSMVLDFNFENSTYQANYISFSNTVYTVVPGQQSITAWFSVKSIAPPTSDTLSIGLERVGVTLNSIAITYVSPIAAVNTQTIIIMGHGFGSMPPTTNLGDGSVDMPNFKVIDGDGRPNWGGNQWEAGYTGDADLIGVILVSWNNTVIVLGGFGSYLGQTNHGSYNCYLLQGDNITISVNGATWTTIAQ